VDRVVDVVGDIVLQVRQPPLAGQRESCSSLQAHGNVGRAY